MKKVFSSILVVLFFCNIVWAQENQPLKIFGSLSTDQRIITGKESEWAWNENRLSLKLEKKVNRGKLYGEIWVRNFGVPNFTNVEHLYNRGIVDPFDVQVREAYFQISDLFIPNLDLKIGRQRIAWGSADQMNPTDNLNPHDLEDILDFGRHRGSDAINLTYYIKNDFSIQAVFIPFFQPANLPVGVFSDAIFPSFELPADTNVKINEIRTVIKKPALKFGTNSTVGFKFKAFVKTVDFSLSYVYGYDGLPFLTKKTVIPIDPIIYPWTWRIDVEAELSYVRQHILGLDFSTNIKGVGVWGEAALFMLGDDVRDSTIVNSILPLIPPEVTDSIVLNRKKPFLKFIIGADYHFGKSSYINVQYMHGFIHERGAKELSDYLFLRYDFRLLNDRLYLAPISGAVIISDWKEVKNNYALVYMPQISYYPIPEVELSLSYIWLNGKGEGLFSKIQDYDMFLIKAKFAF